MMNYVLQFSHVDRQYRNQEAFNNCPTPLSAPCLAHFWRHQTMLVIIRQIHTPVSTSTTCPAASNSSNPFGLKLVRVPTTTGETIARLIITAHLPVLYTE